MSSYDRIQLESKLDDLLVTPEVSSPQITERESLLDQNHSRKLYYELTSPNRQYGEVSRSVLMRDFWPQSTLNQQLKSLTKEMVRSEHGINIDSRSTDLHHHVFNWSSTPQETKPEVKSSVNERLVSLARKRCAEFKQERIETERREAAIELALQMEELKKSEKQEVDVILPKKTTEQKFKFWQFPFFKQKTKRENEYTLDTTTVPPSSTTAPPSSTTTASTPNLSTREAEPQYSQPLSSEDDPMQLEAFTVMRPQRLSKSP